MIKRIFQDLDECILHTLVNTIPTQDYVEFTLGEDKHTYRSIIRPCAKKLFAYYNKIVGKENVYILTTATRDYAEALNRLGEFGLNPDHILTREDIVKYSYKGAWSNDSTTIEHPLADKDNILIDNLQWKYNMSKLLFLGINVDNYYKTEEYYGVSFYDDPKEANFLKGIKKFISKIHNSAATDIK
jgi:hypothetical protein